MSGYVKPISRLNVNSPLFMIYLLLLQDTLTDTHIHREIHTQGQTHIHIRTQTHIQAHRHEDVHTTQTYTHKIT